MLAQIVMDYMRKSYGIGAVVTTTTVTRVMIDKRLHVSEAKVLPFEAFPIPLETFIPTQKLQGSLQS